MIAELYITDGITTINLHAANSMRVKAWTPMILPFKGGGIWSDNPFSEGKILMSAVEDDVIDNFVLMASAANQDLLIKQLRELRMILGRAVDYWTSDVPARPIYLKKRGSCESEYTYTCIKSWSTPEDPAMFENPFTGSRGSSTELSLFITHGAWLGSPPGKGECIALSNELAYLEAGITNMVLNPGFETAGGGGADVFANWTEAAGTGTIVRDVADFRSGVASCRLTAGVGAVPTVTQTFTVAKGDLIRVSFWYKSAVNVSYWQMFDNTNAAIIAGGALPLAAIYTEKSTDIQLAVNTVSITITFSFLGPVAGDIFRIDDVMMSYLQNVTFGTQMACPTSIMFNGGFETVTAANNFTNWFENAGAGTITYHTADKHSGAASVSLLGWAIGQAIIEETFVCIPGRNYELSLWYKSLLMGGYTVTDMTNAVVLATYSLPASATWAHAAVIVTVPSTCLSIKVTLNSPTSAVNNILFDDVAFTPLDNFSPDMGPLLANYAAVLSSTSKVQLTHIFLDSAGTFGPNLLYQTLPYNLFSSIAVNHITYFGAATSLAANTNVVFGLMMRLAGAEQVVVVGKWQHWTGGAWVDVASGGGTGGYGVNDPYTIGRDGDVNYSLAPNSASVAVAVNGVTAFWVRFVPATSAFAGYIQAVDYHPFYPNKPFVTIPAEGLASELPLLADYRIAPMIPVGTSDIDEKYMLSLRSVDRGIRFNPVIPLTRNGQESEIAITGTGGDAAYQVDYNMPSLESIRFTPITGVPITPTITISSPLVSHYVGRYRILMRVRQNNGAVGDITCFMLVDTQAYSYLGQRLAAVNVPDYFDFGIVNLPGYNTEIDEDIDRIRLVFTMVRTTGAATMDLYDLVIIPIDEFAATLSLSNTYFSFPDRIAHVSSLDPKTLVNGRKMDELTTRFFRTVGSVQVITPAELSIPAGKDMFIIVFPIAKKSTAKIQTRLSVFGASRFFDMRGDL